MLEVVLDTLGRLPREHGCARVENDSLVAEIRDRRQVMRHERNRDARSLELLHALHALLLERHVANAQDLVDDQGIGIEVGGDCEPESGVHSRRVALDGRINERAHLRELDNLVNPPRDLVSLHAHDRPLQEDVLPSGEIRVKPGGDLDEGTSTTAHLARSPCGSQNLREQL